MLKKDKELEERSIQFAKSNNESTEMAIRLNALMYREGYNAAINDIDGTTTDGYHTFDELYEYRKLYNAAFFNALVKNDSCPVIKSLRHSDGELCFGGGWFIVMAALPTGQISNHYEIKDWDMFKCEEAEKAWLWDGHSPKEAAERLLKYIQSCQG